MLIKINNVMNHRTDDLLYGGNSNEFEDVGYVVGGRKK
jgi:hypothetical protein